MIALPPSTDDFLRLVGTALLSLLALAGTILAGWLGWKYGKIRHPLDASRIVLVTGAAHGLGFEIARQCVLERRVRKLILVDVDNVSIDALLSGVKLVDTEIECIQCDVGVEEEVKRMRSELVGERLEGEDVENDVLPSVIINCAGIVTGKSFEEMLPSEFRRAVDVNLMGNVHLAHYFLPRLGNSGGGGRGRRDVVIVGIASLMGLMGGAKLTDYCASKFAIVGFYESLRLELLARERRDVTPICICPYVIDTGMFDGIFEATFANRLVKCIFPVLTPRSAARSVLSALEHGTSLVVLPHFMAPLINLVRCVPDPLYDTILGWMGGYTGMDSFRGHRPGAQAIKTTPPPQNT